MSNITNSHDRFFKPEPLIVFYLLRYMVKIWGQLIEQGSKGRLPPIIPLALYHGATRWQVDRRFSRLLDHPRRCNHSCLTSGFFIVIWGSMKKRISGARPASG
ncbi:MAG: Rpn family recombination-promoting nuclease/putative transposase [Deltaproteobacteria bacterium]|nr:Rpn family recombination-promoting nuclease/putative transposase [Deltaproteobacteria bacterium]MBF0526223.1 Rpn family recombination-promoting nuclease/putative transposase [Deltaproteobacteria bacterium]